MSSAYAARTPAPTPARRPAPRRRALGTALLAALGLALLSGGLGAGCLSAPEDACGAEKPCPQGLFCKAGVCLQDEICDGIDNDVDEKTDEAPGPAQCTHPDHSAVCATQGTGCACAEPTRFDVDGDPANGCERSVVGPAVGTEGELVASVAKVDGESRLEAFAVGAYGGVAWVADGRIRLASTTASRVDRPLDLTQDGEVYTAAEGAEVALLEIFVGETPLAEDDATGLPRRPEAGEVLWAVVAERRAPSATLVLSVGVAGFPLSQTRVELDSPGVTDFGAPTVAFAGVDGDAGFTLGVIAYGRAAPGAQPVPLMWVVRLQVLGEPFRLVATNPLRVSLGGAGDYRAEVAPLILPAAQLGSFQTLLVAAAAGDPPRSEVRLNNLRVTVEGAELVERSTGTDRFDLPGVITSHLAFPALGTEPGVYLANLVGGTAAPIDPVALVALGADGRFARVEGGRDASGAPVVAVERLALTAEVLGFAGAGDDGQGAVCLPTRAAAGANADDRQIGLVVAGAVDLQRYEGLFDPSSTVGRLQVSTLPDGTFWGAWSRDDGGTTSLRRAQAACR